MTEKRLFTFGCSYTKYFWPSWANIIATGFDQHYNCAQTGAGNYYAAEKLYEMHLKKTITKNDVVLIMLSSFNRIDIYNPKYKAFNLSGNIYNSEHIYGEKFVREAWNDEHSIYNTWFMVKSMKALLDSIGCEYKILQAFDLLETDTREILKTDDNTTLLINDYKQNVYMVESLQNYTRNYTPQSYGFKDTEIPYELDGHPTIMCHHDFVKDHLSEYYHKDMLIIAETWELELPDTKRECISYSFSKQKINPKII
jgi:hypothetical protein